jgi:hypothetical protein
MDIGHKGGESREVVLLVSAQGMALCNGVWEHISIKP